MVVSFVVMDFVCGSSGCVTVVWCDVILVVCYKCVFVVVLYVAIVC